MDILSRLPEYKPEKGETDGPEDQPVSTSLGASFVEGEGGIVSHGRACTHDPPPALKTFRPEQ